MSDRILSEEDGAALHKIAESYWLSFGKLVDEHLLQVRPALRPLLKALLQDKSSVYGCKSKLDG